LDARGRRAWTGRDAVQASRKIGADAFHISAIDVELYDESAIFVHVCTFAWKGAFGVSVAPGIDKSFTAYPWVARNFVISAAADEMERGARDE
jgi:hypothetical protein